MSARFSIIPARAIDDNRLSRSAFLVLAALGIYANRDGWCHPSQGTLAKRLGTTQPTVSKAIAELLKYGYLEKRRRFGKDGAELTCSYRILIDQTIPKSADRYANTSRDNAKKQRTVPIPPIPPEGIGGIPQEGIGGIPPEGILTTHLNDPPKRPNKFH